jgi:D-alanyl-D-alanine carboxypeptidase/D-alanyl-D-alanine-endopeptidase (penicillin-binding protein 4)
MRFAAILLVLVAFLAQADAKPPARSTAKRAVAGKHKPADPKKLGAVARVNFGRELRPTRDVVGRRAEPLTSEEETAAQIQKLLRGPFLRRGVTGLFVADARTGEPLFAVNADDPLNPASNVKLISTATAIELLGPSFRYQTRLLGPAPHNGVIKGDVYLLGSYDPTLTIPDLDTIARALSARGITQIDGNIVVGTDPTRDGIYRAIIPIEITAGEPGQPPTVSPPLGFDLVTFNITAKTARTAMRSRLTYKTEITATPAGQPRIALTIGGTIGKDRTVNYPLWTKQRTATAAYSLIAALRARQIAFTGEMKTLELGDFVGEAVATGALPVELARHESRSVTEIVARVNKWSINWLADRLVMTAAGLARREPPSMQLAIDAMYAWLDRHPHLPKKSIVLDTGSGLSYRTQISPQEIVSVVRSASGFAGNLDPANASAWLQSLSIVGTDGTLRNRFRGTDLRGRIVGKTGTLSTVIAISGILDVNPQRPLAFSLVTNSDAPLSRGIVRRAHEQVIAEICKYVSKASPVLPPPPAPLPPLPVTDETDETGGPDSALDHETVNQK